MRIILLLSLIIVFQNAIAQSKVSDVKLVAPNIYGFWLDQYENKAVVAEFEKFIVLVEFPQNDSVASDIIAKTAVMFPKKPIKFVLHSHHHGHSISSFDPFLKLTNASLLTTKFNANEIKNKTKDTLALKNRTILYDSIYRIKDKKNEMICYEILQSKYLVPTKEYNIFYFPKQQLVVSGCLFNKPLAYYEVVNARKPALKKFISDNKLSVKVFIPTNTSKANGFTDICTIEQLDEALIKGIQPYQFCDNFQTKSIEYLESKSDSLETEFRKIPRSFDYLVCGNTLRSIRKDYNRAIIVFKILNKIYPLEIDAYLSIAESYESKGSKIEAIGYYEKFISLTKSKEDAIEIKERIEKLRK
jgi:tetratricopeptide (TPR) repeat protein